MKPATYFKYKKYRPNPARNLGKIVRLYRLVEAAAQLESVT
jgi:hypothetical protein